MTRYQLLRLIRRLLGKLPGWHHDWMPRTDDGYKELYIFVGDDAGAYYRVEITIERLQ